MRSSIDRQPGICENPIFIGGMFKSGTTLLRMLLGMHCELFSNLETKWFEIGEGDLSHPEKSNRMGFIKSFFDIRMEKIKEFCKNSESSPEQFLSILMEYCLQKTTKKRWIEKTPENIQYIDRIFEFWPKAQFIHIFRDPRDVYLGRKRAKGLTCEEFIEVTHKMFKPAKKYFGKSSDSYLEIKYEDLVRNTEETMRQVLNFLNEEWDENVLNFSGNSNDCQKVEQITGKTQTTLRKLKKPISTQYIDVWQEGLSQSEVNMIEEELAVYYNKFGYKL